MTIGVLREGGKENRVALLPEHIPFLVKKNVSVLIESDAGTSSCASNVEYVDAGAAIQTREYILENSDIVLKINPPGENEIPAGKILVSILNPLSNTELVKKLAGSGVTAFSLDMTPRTTRAQAVDILSSMATIAGYKAVLVAASKLPNFFPMFMSASGTIKPSKVLILGAGVAGLQSRATSKKLGAVVEVFDVRPAVKEEVMSLGGKFIEVKGSKDDSTAGGYAVEQTEEYKKKQAELIHDHAIQSNVVICTAQIPGKKAPLLIMKETVEGMSPGSVIIDMAAGSGGNCELTKKDETVIHKQVRIIGNSDFPSKMPADASKMLGKNYTNFLELMIDEEGNLKLDFEDEIIAGTCMTRNGEIQNDRVKEIISFEDA
ncbi:MAG: NAD(P)(+) transhydrogenase (Re/Si-specific) subunit alpha [Bacteroidales bacterium]|nr:NAD(P)(+) transhydrogenase (Re/Si-specific) subunit alpha [Bacteroidales bacterium]